MPVLLLPRSAGLPGGRDTQHRLLLLLTTRTGTTHPDPFASHGQTISAGLTGLAVTSAGLTGLATSSAAIGASGSVSTALVDGSGKVAVE